VSEEEALKLKRVLEDLGLMLPMPLRRLQEEFRDRTGCELKVYDWDAPFEMVELRPKASRDCEMVMYYRDPVLGWLKPLAFATVRLRDLKAVLYRRSRVHIKCGTGEEFRLYNVLFDRIYVVHAGAEDVVVAYSVREVSRASIVYK